MHISTDSGGDTPSANLLTSAKGVQGREVFPSRSFSEPHIPGKPGVS